MGALARYTQDNSTARFLPYALPDVGEEEISAVSEAIRSGWVTSGPVVTAFEREFSAFVGGGVEAVAVNSATAGLHLALEACGIGPGDEVIVPTWTFTATAEVVRHVGATPVLVDVDERNLSIDPNAVQAAITHRTRAIIPVHMGGLSVDMVTLGEFARANDLRVVEDAAHALPSSRAGVDVGSARYADATVFSFYANKTMTTGEGGMITTRDESIAKRLRTMRLHGIDRDVFDRYRSSGASWRYDVIAPGYKYNLTDPAAAMGRVQLRRARAMRDRRQAIADAYVQRLADVPLLMPAGAGEGDLHAWHVFAVRVEPEEPGRDVFIEQMTARGVGCSVHFIPLHQHSYWRESLHLSDDMFPVASQEYLRVVSLPIYSRMSDADVDHVVASIHEVFAE